MAERSPREPELNEQHWGLHKGRKKRHLIRTEESAGGVQMFHALGNMRAEDPLLMNSKGPDSERKS